LNQVRKDKKKEPDNRKGREMEAKSVEQIKGTIFVSIMQELNEKISAHFSV
jgi:hypothetical protein